MSVLEEFKAMAGDPHAIGREVKKSGKKVVGYRCVFIPEEIIHAAGMHPYPLFGTPDTVSKADSYFQPCTCEFTRNIFDHALDGKLDFLDGFVMSNTCDVTRRLYDIWNEYMDGPSCYVINNPQKLNSDLNHDYYMEELVRFKKYVEELSGKKVSDAELRKSTLLFNRYRRLMKEIYLMRKNEPSPITAGEALQVSLAALMLPKEKAVEMLEKLKAELADRETPNADGPRILVTGSILDNPTLLNLVEEEGGRVVTDDLCTTVKNFWYEIDESVKNPMEGIYKYQNERTVCACLHPFEDRLEYLLDLVDEFDVEAVVYFNLKYCHPFLYEAPLFKNAFKDRGVELIFLETGHDMSGLGQLRTRVQAFIEMIDLY